MTKPKASPKPMGHQKGVPLSPETRAKLSAIRKGRPMSPEQRAKMSVAMKGNRNGWKGDAVGYVVAHMRHVLVLPRECAHCGRSDGLLDCALRHDAPPEHLKADVDGPNAGLQFSLHADDYIRLCRQCHHTYDRS